MKVRRLSLYGQVAVHKAFESLSSIIQISCAQLRCLQLGASNLFLRLTENNVCLCTFLVQQITFIIL